MQDEHIKTITTFYLKLKIKVLKILVSIVKMCCLRHSIFGH